MPGQPISIPVKLLRPGARMPFRATPDSSGYDIHAALERSHLVVGQHPVVVPTGIALEVPRGYDAQLRPRSGLARKGILATFGTLDADYRGELMITLYAVAPDISHTIQDGDRIAQLVIGVLVEAEFQAVEQLAPTSRGAGGHGSTGR